MSRLISFAVLIAIIIMIGLLFYRVLIGFFIPVFLATVLVVVFRPLHRWVLEKTNYHERLAAAITTLLILLVLLLPIAAVGSAAAVQGLRLIEQNDAQTLSLRINQVRASLGLELPSYMDQMRVLEGEIDEIILNTDDTVVSEENPKLTRIAARTLATLEGLKQTVAEESGTLFDESFTELIEMVAQVGQPSEREFAASRLAVDIKSRYGSLKSRLLGGTILAFARETANPTKEQVDAWIGNAVDYARPRLLSLTGATGTIIAKTIFGTVILVVSTFFFLYDGPAMIKTIMNLSPLDDVYEQELLLEFDRISRAVVLATILSAVAQGLTAGLGFYIAGMEYLTLLILMTTAFAMVPFVGPAVVWIPVCLYLVTNDRVMAAVLLALWGVCVVGTIDNVIKALVLHGQSQLHPLLALLSVLGGVQSLGPIGIVVGPMVVAMLQTLLGILRRELMAIEQQRWVLTTSPPVAESPPASRESTTSRRTWLRTRTSGDSAGEAGHDEGNKSEELRVGDAGHDEEKKGERFRVGDTGHDEGNKSEGLRVGDTGHDDPAGERAE